MYLYICNFVINGSVAQCVCGGRGGGEKLLASTLKLCVCLCVYAKHQTVTKNRGGMGWGKVIPNPSIYLQKIGQ